MKHWFDPKNLVNSCKQVTQTRSHRLIENWIWLKTKLHGCQCSLQTGCKWSHGSLQRAATQRKYQHIRLVNCSFFNTWFNLRWTREISVFDALGTPIVKRISEGNYWLKSLGQALHDTLKSDGVKVEMNTPKGGILKISISSKIHILKVSISFLTMMWLILLGLKDVCKSST